MSDWTLNWSIFDESKIAEGESMSTMNVICRMDEDRVAELDKLGEYYDRDRSFLINQAVDRFLRYHQWQIEEVEKAIAEADAGKVLSQEEFEAEVKTWCK